jgi:hypothetical protein
MAMRPLKAKYETTNNSISCLRTIFCHAKDVKEVYQYKDELDAPSLKEAASDSSPPVTQAIPVPASGPTVSVEDLPLKAVIFTVSSSLRSSRKRLKKFRCRSPSRTWLEANLPCKTRSSEIWDRNLPQPLKGKGTAP